MTKKEAENILKNGGKVYLDNEDHFLEAIGINKDKFVDNTGFLFTDWFYNYAPCVGWNIKK